MKRIDKENYYLDIAETVLERSTCLRRCYGAIIVKNDEIVSTGYNGAPRGRKNCLDLGYCTREAMNIPSGERYELCRSVHAEMNAIISAARRDTLGATLYLAGREAQKTERCFTTPPPVPCAGGLLSTRALTGWWSAPRRRTTPWSTWRTGSGRTTPCPKTNKRSNGRDSCAVPAVFCACQRGKCIISPKKMKMGRKTEDNAPRQRGQKG